jgi:hypothetical protein
MQLVVGLRQLFDDTAELVAADHGFVDRGFSGEKAHVAAADAYGCNPEDCTLRCKLGWGYIC